MLGTQGNERGLLRTVTGLRLTPALFLNRRPQIRSTQKS